MAKIKGHEHDTLVRIRDFSLSAKFRCYQNKNVNIFCRVYMCICTVRNLLKQSGFVSSLNHYLGTALTMSLHNYFTRKSIIVSDYDCKLWLFSKIISGDVYRLSFSGTLLLLFGLGIYHNGYFNERNEND